MSPFFFRDKPIKSKYNAKQINTHSQHNTRIAHKTFTKTKKLKNYSQKNKEGTKQNNRKKKNRTNSQNIKKKQNEYKVHTKQKKNIQKSLRITFDKNTTSLYIFQKQNKQIKK